MHWNRLRIAAAISLIFLLTVTVAVLLLIRRQSHLMAGLQGQAGPTFVTPDAAKAVEAQQAAVTYARSMLGLPYDPLMGKYGDPFGHVGFVVCIDVPIRAYLAAGVPIPTLMKQSAKEHPDWFKIGPNNAPSNSFFYRRVRNYQDLFKNHPGLMISDRPQSGDWAFYGRTHIALVAEVSPDGRFQVIEASPIKMRVALSSDDYMLRTWGAPTFFGRLR